VMWYPKGRYTLIFFEVEEGVFSDLPEQFKEAKDKAGPQEEFKMTENGIKKWTKQIESIEWVAASELSGEAKRDCSDLLKNVLDVKAVSEFLDGTLDPEVAFPDDVDGVPRVKEGLPPKDGKGAKSKGKGKAGKDGYGKGSKGGKGYKGGNGYGKGGKSSKGFMPMGMGMGIPPPYAPVDYGKGGGKSYPQYSYPPMMGGQQQQIMPQMMPLVAPLSYQPVEVQQGSDDLQLQMYGEQLHILVHPLVPNQYIAQKVTGMLLELPMNELLMNLTNPPELLRRVNEATQLLKEDGIV